MQFWTIFFITLSGTFALLRVTLSLLQQQHRTFSIPKNLAPYYEEKKYQASQHIAHINTWGDIARNILLTSFTIYALAFGWFGQAYAFLGDHLGKGIIQNVAFFVCYTLFITAIVMLTKNIALIYTKKHQPDLNIRQQIFKHLQIFGIIGLLVVVLSFIVFFILFQFPSYAWLVLLIVLFIIRKQFHRYMSSIVIKTFFMDADKPSLIYMKKTARPINAYLESDSEKFEQIYRFITQTLQLSINQVKFFESQRKSNNVTGYCYLNNLYIDSRFLDNDFDNNELFALIAHEAAHLNEPIRFSNYIFLFFLFFFIFGLHFSNTMEAWSVALGFTGNAPVLNLIAFLWISSKVKFIANIIEKHQVRQQEYQADHLSVQATNKEAVRTLLKKVSGRNLTPVNIHPWQEFFYKTHPSLTRRLEFIEQTTTRSEIIARLTKKLQKHTNPPVSPS
ncbi:M48 family metalloprotease [Microscilla marina]|uniref:Peptidase, M48 family n=1 Tax=Microscilla marina ATCC 23134 TaxID=313606 RepID=A1ZSN8_MICM2|nr:M48 family metalloprotease [Microscilla marina]EAY26618.1 peptidase, M48 family [Microscilla marina ATCC 23134]